MKIKITDIIAIALVLFIFRGPILEYGAKVIDYIDTQVVEVVNIDEPTGDILGEIRATSIDEFEYTYNDKRVLGVYFNEFSKQVLEIDGKKSNEVILNHFADSVSGFVNDEKLDQKYDGLTDDIKALFKSAVAEDETLGQIGEKEIKRLSDLSRGIAWVIVND